MPPMKRPYSEAQTHEPGERFSKEEVESIIRDALAAESSDYYTRSDLMDVADRLGIDRRALDQVLAQHAQKSSRSASQQSRREEFKLFLMHHGGRFVMISLFLFLLNLATSRFVWCIFPILGMGLGLGFKILERIQNPNQSS